MRKGGAKPQQVFFYPFIILITITVKYLELTNHETWLNFTIICEAETFCSFSQSKKNLPRKLLLLLSSNFARIPVYTRSIETSTYKSKIKIGIRLRSCTSLSSQK